MSFIPQAYFDSISIFPLLTSEQEAELAELVAQGDPEARERFTQCNLRLVIKIAMDYRDKGIPIDDLISEGNIGLMRAVEGYVPQPGARFADYASQWIKQSIGKLIKTKASLVRVSMSRKKIATWNEAKDSLTVSLGREPTTEEIGKHLGLSNRQVKLIVQAITVIRLQKASLSGGDDDAELGAIIADPSSTLADEAVERADLLERLPFFLARLDEQELVIIRMSFGLDGFPISTLGEICKALGFHRDTVSKIKKRALSKLAA